MKTKWLLVMLLGLVLFAAPAQAVPFIDFGDGDAAGIGSIIFSGGNAVGTGIGLDRLLVLGTGATDGAYDLSGAIAAPLDPTDGTAAALNFDTAANTVSIVGGVPGLGIADDTLLLTGSFSSFTITATSLTFFMSAAGRDEKDLEFLAALGITDPNFSFLAFTIGAKQSTDNMYTPTSTDLQNIGKVPEPISLILLGSGLAGAGLYRRFRKPRG